jgi:hypothetical protein
LPIEPVPASFQWTEIYGCRRAERLIGFIKDYNIPGRFSLENRKVVFATAFAADYGIPVPIIITNQPYPN